MAVLHKLSICGIRSFAPMHEEHITFSTPVTMFLGQNGCGKTTIIEAIKYACTGDIPSGASGGKGFLNDPSLSSQYSTKGSVKIQFFDQQGNEITVGRFMQVLHKGSTVTFKTLLPQIKVKKKDDTGPGQDITGRCVDINAYCSQALNTSPAVLNNVLFCHQEHSSWPLDEAKKLKERFDEIFDAVKYNKCVDALRKMAKTREAEIKLMKEQLTSCKDIKERAQLLNEKIEDRVRKLASIEDEIQQKSNELRPIEDRMKQILDLEDSLGTLQRQLTAKQEQRKGLAEQQNNIKKHIPIVYEGTDEELQKKLNTFEEDKTSDLKAISELEKREIVIEDKVLEIRKTIQQVNVKIGQLKEEKRQQTKRFEEREELIGKSRRELQIQSTSDINKLEDSEYIIREFKSTLEAKQLYLDDLIMEKEMEESELQRDIDQLIERHSKTKQEIITKNTLIAECQQKIRQFNNKLADLNNKGHLMQTVTEKLEEVQRSLFSIIDSVNETEKTEEIEKCNEDITRKTRILDKLEGEYRILQQNNVTEEMIEKEKESISDKKSKILKSKNKHSDNLAQLFDKNVPNKNLSMKINQILNKDELKLKELNHNYSAVQKEVTKLEIEIKNKKNEINNNENLVKSKKNKINELCKGEALENVLNATLVEKEEKQNKKGSLSSAKYMYESFINEFENKKPCPVCKTDLGNSEAAIKKVIAHLKDTIKNIPQQIVINEKELKETENLYNKLQQLTPVDKEIKLIMNSTLPNATKELDTLSTKLETLYAQMEMTKCDIDERQKKVDVCRSLISDATLIDQYQSDIINSENNLGSLRLNLVKLPSERSRQETEAEIDNIKSELTMLRSKCEAIKRNLDKHRNRCQELRIQKEKYLEKQMILQRETQERPHLEKQKEECQETMNKSRNDVEVLSGEEKKINTELNNAKEKKRDVCQSNKEFIQQETKIINDHKKLVENIEKLQKTINEYIENRNEEKLATSEAELEQLQSKEMDLNTAKTKILSAVSSKKENLAKQESDYRALKDNVLLREKIKQEKEMGVEVAALEQQIGKQNYRSVYEEKQRLEKKKTAINREINNIEGQKRELKITLREFKMEADKPINVNAHREYKKKFFELKIAELVLEDLMKYTVALEKSILQFHKDRMVHINKLIRELWRAIYRGNDVDYIEIQTENIIGNNAKKRSYVYKVVQVKRGVELEMRGRCSAGQRVLACLVIRMALAETFSSHCGILALDEPTTNLDRPNILSLSDALTSIIENRRNEKNFQLLIITHDEEFLNTLTRRQTTPHYWKVSRNEEGFSIVRRVTT